jgi:hypothetical protein
LAVSVVLFIYYSSPAISIISVSLSTLLDKIILPLAPSFNSKVVSVSEPLATIVQIISPVINPVVSSSEPVAINKSPIYTD